MDEFSHTKQSLLLDGRSKTAQFHRGEEDEIPHCSAVIGFSTLTFLVLVPIQGPP
jgi:hypothetical protein